MTWGQQRKERAVDHPETPLHLGMTCVRSGMAVISVMLGKTLMNFLITYTRLQPPKPVHVTRYTNRASNVSSPADHRTLQGQQRRFTTRAPAGSEAWVLWMGRQPPKGILGLAPLSISATDESGMGVIGSTNHDTLRQVGLCNNYRTKLSEHAHKKCIRCRRSENTTYIP